MLQDKIAYEESDRAQKRIYENTLKKLSTKRKEELKLMSDPLFKSAKFKEELTNLKTLFTKEPALSDEIFMHTKLNLNDRAKIALQNFFNVFKQSLGGCLNFDKLVGDGYLVPTVTGSPEEFMELLRTSYPDKNE